MHFPTVFTLSVLVTFASAYPTPTPQTQLISKGNVLRSEAVLLAQPKRRRGFFDDLGDAIDQEWDEVQQDIEDGVDEAKDTLFAKKPRGWLNDLEDALQEGWERTKEGLKETKETFEEEVIDPMEE